jgi:hypothetical protein
MSKAYELEKHFKEMEAIAKSHVIMLHEDVRQEQLDKIDRIHKWFMEESGKRATGEEAGEYMENFVNMMGNRQANEDFVKKIVYGTHRTLNQGLIGLFFDVIKEEAKLMEPRRFDDRNEASVRACDKLTKVLAEVYLPFI